METIFESVLRAGLSGSVIITVILGLRLILRNTPRRYICLLWMLAVFRLLIPFSIESPLSLQPDTSQVSAPRQDVILVVQEASINPDADRQTVTTALVPHDRVINTSASLIDGQIFDQMEYYYDWTVLIPAIWAAVACGFLGYTIVSYWLLKRKVRDSVLLDRNIFESPSIDTPFLLGYLAPNIYLPTGLPIPDLEHILAHEQAHIRRKDNWIKLLGFLALSIHWFNPLVCLAYVLLCRDIEIACDEDVVTAMPAADRKAYASALLHCAAGRRIISACPIAFGEVSVKQRIPKVLNFRKPSVWISAAAVIALIFVVLCFLTDPAPGESALVAKCRQALEAFQARSSYRITETVETNDDSALLHHTQSDAWVSGDNWLRSGSSSDSEQLFLQKDGRQFVKFISSATEELAFPEWTETDLSSLIGWDSLLPERYQWDEDRISFQNVQSNGEVITLTVLDDQLPNGYYTLEFRFDSAGTLLSLIREVTWEIETGEPRYIRTTFMFHADSPEAIAGHIDSCFREASE